MHVITDLVTFAIFHWLEASHQSPVPSSLKRRGKGMKTSKGAMWDHFKICLPAGSFFLFFLFCHTGSILSPPTRDGNCAPCGVNHWTTREVPATCFFLASWGQKDQTHSCIQSQPTIGRSIDFSRTCSSQESFLYGTSCKSFLMLLDSMLFPGT